MIIFNDSYQLNSNKPIDNKYEKFISGASRPYLDLDEVNQTVVSEYRYIGLTVLVASTPLPREFWYANGILDINLVLKTNGVSGQSGVSGYSGTSGVSGATGPGGGDSGVSGASGQSGISGTSGKSGYSGQSGTSGVSGVGQSGISGYSGAGLSGTSGATGTSGASGKSGYSGQSGSVGPGGGDSGVSGASGISGTSGKSGYSGQQAASGVSGASGQSGTSGTSGVSGLGLSGISGTSGQSGVSGGIGISGISGYSGRSGASGVSGGVGSIGISGTSGYSGTTLDMFLGPEFIGTGLDSSNRIYIDASQLSVGSIPVARYGAASIPPAAINATGGAPNKVLEYGGTWIQNGTTNIQMSANGAGFTIVPPVATGFNANVITLGTNPTYNFVNELKSGQRLDILSLGSEIWLRANNVSIEADVVGVQQSSGNATGVSSQVSSYAHSMRKSLWNTGTSSSYLSYNGMKSVVSTAVAGVSRISFFGNSPNSDLSSGTLLFSVLASGIPTYANDAGATGGGLVTGDLYKTSTGGLQIVL